MSLAQLPAANMSAERPSASCSSSVAPLFSRMCSAWTPLQEAASMRAELPLGAQVSGTAPARQGNGSADQEASRECS